MSAGELLEPKTIAALLQLGPRKILSDLVNIPPGRGKDGRAEAEKFIERYGPLRPYREYPKGTKERLLQNRERRLRDLPKKAKTFIEEVEEKVLDEIEEDERGGRKWHSWWTAMHYAEEFRKAWDAKTEGEIDHVNFILDNIFIANFTDVDKEIGGFTSPVLRADFLTGRCQMEPHTFLDHLAVALMTSRKMLHRCERPECRRYFVKEFSRDRYCSIACGEEMRKRGQSRWVEANREQRNRKRRKPHRK